MATTKAGFKQRVIGTVVRRFGRPRGVGGRLVGWVMAHRGSNRRRSGWVVSLLDVRPADRVLEVGFGPGLAITELARLATRGHVHGSDHSEVMVRRASRHNADAIRAGRVELVRAPAERLPAFGEPFDAVLAVNTVGFWRDPAERLRDLRCLLRPGGRIALASQPRCPGAARATTARAAVELEDLRAEAGFAGFRTETLPLDPPVACVVAVNPALDPRGQGGQDG
jgi:SAM-dependent methyltransferase